MILSTGKLHPHTVLVNDLNKFNVEFLDATYTAVAPATATKLRVLGFGEFDLASLRAVKAKRAKTGQLQRLNVSSATPAEITLVAPPAPNTEVTFEVLIKSTRYLAEFHNSKVTRDVRRTYQVILQPTDTTATVLAKLYNAIKFEDPTRPNTYIDTDAAGFASVGTIDPVTGRASSITELNLQAKYEFTKIVFQSVQDATTNAQSGYITVFAPTTVQQGFEGVNDYSWMTENIRILTESSVYPFAYFGSQMPIDGNLYSDFIFDVKQEREGIYNHGAADADVNTTTRYQLFINQNTCEATIDNLAAFFNQVTLPTTPVYSAYVGGVYTNGTSLVQFQTNV